MRFMSGRAPRWSRNCVESSPPLEETEVTRERLALEESIRKVEAEAARRARTEAAQSRLLPRPHRRARRACAAVRRPAAATSAAAAIRHRRAPAGAVTMHRAARAAARMTRAAAPHRIAALRAAHAAAVPPAAAFEPRRAPPPLRRSRRAPRPPTRPRAPAPTRSRRLAARFRRRAAAAAARAGSVCRLPAAHDFDRLDEGPHPRIDPRALRRRRATNRSRPISSRRPNRGAAPRPRSRAQAPGEDEEPAGLGRSYGGIIKAAIAAVLVLGLVGFGYWQRATFVGLYQALRGSPIAGDAPERDARRLAIAAENLRPHRPAEPDRRVPRSRSASSSTKKSRPIRRASAISGRRSGAPRPYRPGPASRPNSRCAPMSKSPSAASP